jgi:hypothetical protein
MHGGVVRTRAGAAWTRSRLGVLPAGAALVAGAACSSGGAPPAGSQAPATEPPPGFSATLLQYSHDAVAKEVVVKVANGSEREFTVDTLGVSAPGFEEIGPFRFGTVVPPGRAFDLRMPYGTPECGEPSTEGPTTVAVTFADADAEAGTVEVPVQGADVLARIHDATCAAEAVRSAVPLSWGPDWSLTGSGDELTAVGRLEVGPVAEGEQATLGTFNPTTLFQISLPRPPGVLRPGQRVTVPAHVRPTRCDPHALGESPQGFQFELRVRLAPDSEALVPVLPPPEVKRFLQDYWVRRCDVG